MVQEKPGTNFSHSGDERNGMNSFGDKSQGGDFSDFTLIQIFHGVYCPFILNENLKFSILQRFFWKLIVFVFIWARFPIKSWTGITSGNPFFMIL